MSTEDECKLFVAGLPDSMTEDSLRQIFEATGGTVVEVSMPRHRDTRRPRGFGFVTFAEPSQASAARSALDGSFQEGRSISVRPFQSGSRREREPRGGGSAASSSSPSAANNAPERTLYVGNLPYDATQQEVEELINNADAGPVVRVHLPKGPDGRVRGFGFVTMGSAEAATAVVSALAGAAVRGRKLMVNIAHPRGERPARSERPSGRPPGGGGGGGGGGFDRPPRSYEAAPPMSFPASEIRRATRSPIGTGRQEKEKAEEPAGACHRRKAGTWTPTLAGLGSRRLSSPDVAASLIGAGREW